MSYDLYPELKNLLFWVFLILLNQQKIYLLQNLLDQRNIVLRYRLLINDIHPDQHVTKYNLELPDLQTYLQFPRSKFHKKTTLDLRLTSSAIFRIRWVTISTSFLSKPFLFTSKISFNFLITMTCKIVFLVTFKT